MKYVILIHESEAEFAQHNDPAKAGTYWGRLHGVWRSPCQGRGDGLRCRTTIAAHLPQVGQREASYSAYTRALGLSEGTAVRQYLEGRRDALGGTST
mgnify:CR=1 FL=1